MSLNNTPSSERVQIAFFGKTNAGKSSLINAITGQEISLVSDVKGTTTDPIKKAMELLPLGPVTLIDTPGLDDDTQLGELRRKRTMEIMKHIHMAVIVVDAAIGKTEVEEYLEEQFKQEQISYLYVYNKVDLLSHDKDVKKESKSGVGKGKSADEEAQDNRIVYVSAYTKENLELLKEKIASLKVVKNEKKLVADLLREGDHVVLVIPIDKAAPKGRLILPQQQTIRDILDANCTLSICQVENVVSTLQMLERPPKLVITDSQVFGKVKELVPQDINLTSFSILFARYKGDLEGNVAGAKVLDKLLDGDKVLVSEGCTHHRQCGDIGSEKLPNWILKYTGKNIKFEFTSGGNFPEELSSYRMIIHCGACMLNEKQMQERISRAKEQKVPMTNYGIAIAYLNGILGRSIQPFGL